MDIVNFKKVSRSYGSVRALREIDVCIKAGEWVSIMGPSGSGKSTLLNLIGCLDKETSGEVFIENEDLSKLKYEDLTRIRREKIGFIFQEFHLIAYLTAVENIMLAQHYHSIADEDEALSALERVGLKDRAAHLPSELSGGEQQRVCIARALINYPSLILADEPTGNLDEANEKIVMDIFSRLHSEGHTIVMVTHNPELGRLADRQIYLEHGKAVAIPVSACNFDKAKEEVLQGAWSLREEGKNKVSELLRRVNIADKAFLEYLAKSNLLRIEADNVCMTEEGMNLARGVVRRHRLAEALLFNTLHLDRMGINKDACELEHILTQEATDKICAFLGHPAKCPHGKDIPPGECCKTRPGLV